MSVVVHCAERDEDVSSKFHMIYHVHTSFMVIKVEGWSVYQKYKNKIQRQMHVWLTSSHNSGLVPIAMERRMVTPSLYVRKSGVRAQGLHSPTSCESADFPSAHPQLVGLCRVLNPIFHGSADSCM